MADVFLQNYIKTNAKRMRKEYRLLNLGEYCEYVENCLPPDLARLFQGIRGMCQVSVAEFKRIYGRKDTINEMLYKFKQRYASKYKMLSNHFFGTPDTHLGQLSRAYSITMRSLLENDGIPSKYFIGPLKPSARIQDSNHTERSESEQHANDIPDINAESPSRKRNKTVADSPDDLLVESIFFEKPGNLSEKQDSFSESDVSGNFNETPDSCRRERTPVDNMIDGVCDYISGWCEKPKGSVQNAITELRMIMEYINTVSQTLEEDRIVTEALRSAILTLQCAEYLARS
jgi:hypothetical protein